MPPQLRIYSHTEVLKYFGGAISGPHAIICLICSVTTTLIALSWRNPCFIRLCLGFLRRKPLVRWLLSLLILNFYPMALSFEHQRPEIREALFQCRLAMKDYFDLKESASIQEISLDEETLGISLQSADINIIRKISENKKAAVENTFAKNYENQLKICQRKTHDKSEIEDFYRAFKREYRDIDCEAKLVDSNLKPSEVKTLCQGAKYFDLVFFKSENRRPNLILIGETHVMGSGAELAGQQILDTFKLRAVEGYNGKFDSRNLMGVGYEFVMTLAKIGLIGTSNIIRARNNGYYLWSDGDQSEKPSIK